MSGRVWIGSANGPRLGVDGGQLPAGGFPFTRAEAPGGAALDDWLNNETAPRALPTAPTPRDQAGRLHWPRKVPGFVVCPPEAGLGVLRNGCSAQLATVPQHERELPQVVEQLGAEFFDPSPLPTPSARVAVSLGERGDLHDIGVLARSLKRKTGTVRQWEHRGYLPPAAHFGPAGGAHRIAGDGSSEGRRRMYTTAEIEAAIQIASDEGLLLGKGQVVDISKTRFPHRLREAWERLREQEAAR